MILIGFSANPADWIEQELVDDRLFHFESADIDPSTLGGRLYQGWTFFLTLIVPFLTTAQMTARFFAGSIYANCECDAKGISAVCQTFCGSSSQGAKVAVALQQFDFFRLSSIDPMLRFGEPTGPQFFPMLPWIYTAWGIVVLGLWIFAVWSIVTGRASKPI
ncbi:MAG: hypothetical protein AB3X44_21525 [Leptothrix sp. (in: b-proteobacteria)]